MDRIIPITGKVNFSITLDPSVWIFDDRKVELEAYFFGTPVNQPKEEEDLQKISAYWDREIQEGAVFPPTLKTEKTFAKEKLLTGTFVMPLAPFLQNAEVLKDATTFVIVTENNDVEIPLEKAYDVILCFSKEGKPLKEDGPVHLYFGDGSNREQPITHVRQFIVR